MRTGSPPTAITARERFTSGTALLCSRAGHLHAGAGTIWVGSRDRGMLLAAERGDQGPLEG